MHLAVGGQGILPGLEEVGKAAGVLGAPAEDAQGDGGEHAEGALAAHQDLVEIGTGGGARVGGGLDHAAGGDHLLGDDDVLDLAVVGGILPGAAGDHPAAHAGMLEGLREMTAGVAVVPAQLFGGVVEGVLERGTPDAGLHGDGLVGLVEGDHPVEVGAEIQADAVLHRLHAAGDGGAAAVDVERDAVLIAVLDDGDDLLAGARGEHGIGEVLDDLVAQAQGVDHGGAVGGADAVEGIQAQVVFADDGGERLAVLGSETGRDLDVHRLHERAGTGEVIVAEIEGLLDQGSQPAVGMLEAGGVTVFEEAAPGAFGGDLFAPGGGGGGFISHGHLGWS